MDTHASRAEARAESLWRRLRGMFGSDSVERKFGAEPPREWIAMLGRLTDSELERGLRRLAYNGNAHVPTLPEFVHLCRDVGGTGDMDEGPRPAPANALPNPYETRPWLVQGNLHLLAYIRTHVNTRTAARYADRFTQPLVDAKNAWVEDMEADAKAGIKHPDGGRADWNYAMQNAEERITAMHASEAA